MIEVFHANAPTWGMTDPAWPAAYTKVAEVETDDLDRAYELTNHIDRAWFTNTGVRAFGAPRLRSTSVGDVLVLDGTAYRVATAGFTRIELPNEPEAEEYGVVAIESDRCVFASELVTKTHANRLADTVGGQVVDAETLRHWKRTMFRRRQ